MDRRSPWIPLFLLDALLVVLFAALGRQSHEHGLTPLGILQTAAPFLAALALFTWATRPRATISRTWPAGVIVWAGTVVLGLALRVGTGATAAVPFVVVTAVTLGVFLLGRRAAVGLAARRKVRAGRAVN
ncbi:hypothetical protein NCCP1664_06170 [Zafaria cholistanensis]|uniref:DUF3054 domain-containing protein n=1 Tax=Zafaria cholistanensis TaxID=1682741 RepID=A0A5A7NMW3_9MICC|nr:DUF3054 domain-containing protein [Zafaria cholistanensis]GER22120.1 hypothetical protein NCCP1664_06170 [Zafaria cholistanensis]